MFGAAGFIGELVAGTAHAGAFGVATLNHELGYDAMEDGAVVELVAFLAAAGPLFGAFGKADEVSYGDGCFFFEELGDDGAFGGFEVGVSAWFFGHDVNSPCRLMKFDDERLPVDGGSGGIILATW